jgi:hypothetical protein
VLHHVLEHVGRPLETLRAARAALRPGGILVISVPRLDALPLHGDLRYCINARTHIVSYTRDCLMTLLGLAGFAGIDVTPPLDVPVRKAYMLRRLQMLGVKGGAAGSPPSTPLAAARRAFRRYHTAQRTSFWNLALPVRVRAALLNRQRLASASVAVREHRL